LDIEQKNLPLASGQTGTDLISILTPVILIKSFLDEKVEQKKGADLIIESAINLYEGVNQKEVEAFYAGKIDPRDPRPVALGLNSKVVKKNGKIVEEVYRSGGRLRISNRSDY